ncbi:class I SAM-dependent methyltransferase [Actinospica durhamensis]|uniref:Class I SAM-dependent methyltransferase n=1 Tax=Actinospica durhamensis TaxID=1508375 RepID=A0A941EL42_9ACTN|nr:class I SAM-dependent methyltransferase [Actinospica durhamensis]MBR7832885.1 class I SAM-dependent methyltransferase [Actinospica durhamensis]
MPRDDAARLFAGAAEAYAEYRPGYPDELFDLTARRLAFTADTRIADLGCGPGTATIPLARRVGGVVAVDPNTEMLEVAQAAAARAGIGTIEFHQGHAEDLPKLEPGPVEHAVFGRSFHWTDRDAVVAMLDALLPPHGAIVLLGSARTVAYPWDAAVRAVRERFLGTERRAGSGTYSHPAVSHADLLVAGPFGAVEPYSFDEDVEYDLEYVLGLQRSYSHSAEHLFGERYGEFQDALREAVLAACGPGPYPVVKQDTLIIARRPRA